MPDIQQRIAAIIGKHGWSEWREQCECFPADRSGWQRPGDSEAEYNNHVAEVLVSELGLTRETAETYFGGHQCVNVSRYATEWTPDV